MVFWCCGVLRVLRVTGYGMTLQTPEVLQQEIIIRQNWNKIARNTVFISIE